MNVFPHKSFDTRLGGCFLNPRHYYNGIAVIVLREEENPRPKQQLRFMINSVQIDYLSLLNDLVSLPECMPEKQFNGLGFSTVPFSLDGRIYCLQIDRQSSQTSSVDVYRI